MQILLSIAATLAVGTLGYVVANRRLRFRFNRLQLEMLISFFVSVVFAKLLAIDSLRESAPIATSLRLIGFTATFNMVVVAVRLYRTLRTASRA